MLDIGRMTELMRIERTCVSREDCDRDCGACDLVQERHELLAAFDGVIGILEDRTPMKPAWRGSGVTWHYACGGCGQAIDPGDAYCRRCGKGVLWDD